jgi:hypothetical protein
MKQIAAAGMKIRCERTRLLSVPNLTAVFALFPPDFPAAFTSLLDTH